MIILTENDNGTTLQLSQDSEVCIVLKWNPSTGYCWQECDCSAGEVQSVETEEIYKDSEAIGSPINAIYKFKITNPGIIKLVYNRPWAETKPPIKTFEVRINVD